MVSKFFHIMLPISGDLAKAESVSTISAFKPTSIEQVTKPSKIEIQAHSRFSQNANLDMSSCSEKFVLIEKHVYNLQIRKNITFTRDMTNDR